MSPGTLNFRHILFVLGISEPLSILPARTMLLKHPPLTPRKILLRTTLVIPFVVQLVATVGLVGYLSFKNSQKAINDLANQFNREISRRIEQHITAYFNKSHQILRVTDDSRKSGNLDLQNFERLQYYFFEVVKDGDLESYLSYGNEQGEFVGVEHLEDGSFHLKIRTWLTEPIRDTFLLDPNNGDRIESLKSAEYDPRTRPWYKAAKAAGNAAWSPVYPFFSRQNKSLGMSAVRPVFNDLGELQGVLCINITLMRITDFLKYLYISSQGQSFIIERSGDLVVSSTIDETFISTEKDGTREIERLPAISSGDQTVEATTQHLLDHFGDLSQIQHSQSLKFKIDQEWHYAQVLPIQDGRGIDWLAVVVVPESDFMAEIHKNTRTTLMLCLTALGISIILGLVTARWITYPVIRITKAAEEIATGHLDQEVPSSPITELQRLTQSFNVMAGQLKTSFTALRDSEARNRALLEAIPDLIVEIDRDGVYIDCVEAKEMTMLSQLNSASDLIGKTVYDSLPRELASSCLEAIHQSLSTQETQTVEYELTINGELQTYESRVVAASDRSALLIVRDITKRKQAEEALRLMNEQLEERVEQRTAELRREKDRSEQLLLNILPAQIAERLKKSNESLAEHFESATILFADIVGFTTLSTRLEPMQLVAGLNEIFSAFDQFTEKYGLEKIKTIGDAYMVVGGLPVPRADHAPAIADMALEMQAYMKTVHNMLGESLQIRIGINTGPVIAGVIGIKKFIYDLWGDAVNVASRMESHGQPGAIQVTDTTYQILKDDYILEPRGTIPVKGRGEMMTYWLMSRKS